MYPNKEFDVIIIGAGVIGSAIARYLTRFEANILVLEKHNDVGDEASGANSGIVHSGYDPLPGTNKAKFNVLGAKMMKKVCEELDVPYQNIGSLTISFNEEDNKTLLDLQKRGFENGVNTKILTREETLALEPNLSKEVCGALLAPTAGIVSPFELTVKLMENAIDNGAVLKLNSEVIKITKIDKFYKVFCKNGTEFISKCIVDAAGLYSDKVEEFVEKSKFKITPRKGEYFVLDHFDPNFIKHTIFMCPTKVGKGVLISQTTSGNYLVGPSNDASDVDDTSTDSETLNAFVQAEKSEPQVVLSRLQLAEKQVLRYMLESKDVIEKYDIKLGYFSTPIYREIANIIAEYTTHLKDEKDYNIKNLMAFISSEDYRGKNKEKVLSQITDIALDSYNIPPYSDEQFNDLVETINRERVENQTFDVYKNSTLNKSEQEKAEYARTCISKLKSLIEEEDKKRRS